MLAAWWMPGSTFPMLAASSMPLSKTQHKYSILFDAGIFVGLSFVFNSALLFACTCV
jgi:hypothetical protein